MKDNINYEQAKNILKNQKEFFKTGQTLTYQFRMEKLNNLYSCICKYTDEIEKALAKDLGKSKTESYLSEIGMVLSSITHTKKHLKKWMNKEKIKTPIHSFGSKSYVMYEPYGNVLILGPFNYPFQLVIEPLIASISAGNCCILSPSELTPNVSNVIMKIISEIFKSEYVCCVNGSIDTNTALLKCKFDYIFFTGSINVGKIVMRAASENLVPVTLELGGKSPVIVDKSSKLDVICQRIVWGKFMNAGQTCVAPDYVFVERDIYDAFLEKIKSTIIKFYGECPQDNLDYGKIVNDRHMHRLIDILKKDNEYIFFGGRYDIEKRFIEPTILTPENYDAACMQEEIFGPIMPIFPYDNIENVIEFINNGEIPLALYVFSEDDFKVNKILSKIQSGGVSVNDTITHIINPNLPFGGKGHSGMGSYHGKYGFLTFSHKRAVLKKSTKINITLAFPPYSDEKLDKLKKLFR